MKQKSLNLIKELSNANGVSGFEDEVVEIVNNRLETLGHTKIDSMRNLYFDRYNQSQDKHLPIVQVDAHSDEVGFIVQAIMPNGMLKFLPVGGWVANNIPAHSVRIKNIDGNYISGIVASKPPHFMSEAEKKQGISIAQMAIDIGSTSKAETIEQFRIGVGAPIVPDVQFQANQESTILRGKAFDCRIGCACLVESMKQLANTALDVHVVGTLSTQEEVGTRGAKVTAQTVKPDLAIVLEGAPADDTFTEPYLIQSALKKGPMLRHFDSTMITNPRYQRFVLDLAKKHHIPVQEGVRSGGGTNASIISLTEQGVPSIVIGIPVRYPHTHYGYVAYEDYEAAVALTVKILKVLNQDIIDNF